jgi:nucleotide-binding universal stress UspA family protein
MSPAPKSILVAVTSPAESSPAVAVAASLAGGLGAELIVAATAPLAPPGPVADIPGEVGVLIGQAEKQRLVDRLVQERLDEIVAGLPPGLRTRTRVTLCPVGPGIVALAGEESADLVVVAMQRGSELHHLLHDHTDRHVLHHCGVPVLVVPADSPQAASRSGGRGLAARTASA